MSKIIEAVVIERAIKLIESGWCQCTEARDADEDRVSWCSKRAVRFCAMGAIKRAARDVTGRKDVKLARNIIRSFDAMTEAGIMAVNDLDGKELVLKVMRERLEML